MDYALRGECFAVRSLVCCLADSSSWIQSKGSGGRTNDYRSTRQDDYSDDGYGSSEDEKQKKPSSKKKGGYPASDASYDSDPDQNPSKRGKASANTGKGDNDDDDQQEEEKENGNSKKWWWIGGLAAILVALLIIGGMYLVSLLWPPRIVQLEK